MIAGVVKRRSKQERGGERCKSGSNAGHETMIHRNYKRGDEYSKEIRDNQITTEYRESGCRCINTSRGINGPEIPVGNLSIQHSQGGNVCRTCGKVCGGG